MSHWMLIAKDANDIAEQEIEEILANCSGRLVERRVPHMAIISVPDNRGEEVRRAAKQWSAIPHLTAGDLKAKPRENRFHD